MSDVFEDSRNWLEDKVEPLARMLAAEKDGSYQRRVWVRIRSMNCGASVFLRLVNNWD
jgi:hypothetical protein